MLDVLIAVVTVSVPILLTFGLNMLSKKFNWDEGEREVWQGLATAAQKLYDEQVKALKDGRADGKLTKEEAKKMRDIAVENAKQYLTKNGKKVYEVYGKDKLNALLERVIKKAKE
jgi:hypothetical protein